MQKMLGGTRGCQTQLINAYPTNGLATGVGPYALSNHTANSLPFVSVQ